MNKTETSFEIKTKSIVKTNELVCNKLNGIVLFRF